MSENTYKPIRLTKGKSIDYTSLLRRPPTNTKDLTVRAHSPNEELARLGIRGETVINYKKDKNGNILRDNRGNPITVTQFTPTEVPAWFTKAIMVLSGHEPCYFEGCEQIVADYKTELHQMESRPGGCKDCEKAKLKRKYSTKFRDALPPAEANKIAPPSIPPHTVTNLATHETISVPRQDAPYTIRRAIPQSIKDAFTKRATEGKLIVNGKEMTIDELRELQQPQRTEDTGATESTGSPSSGGTK